MSAKSVPFVLLVAATTLVGAVVAGALVGIEVSLLIIAGGALVGVIGLLWASVQSLTGETPLTLEEALSLGAPSAEEEQKRAVLRALKDLEFERSVGKITQEDYVELSNRYRAEARRLIHQIDLGGEKEREAIERMLAEKLEAAASKPARTEPAKAEPAPASEPDPREETASDPEPLENEKRERVAAPKPAAAPKAAEEEGA